MPQWLIYMFKERPYLTMVLMLFLFGGGGGSAVYGYLGIPQPTVPVAEETNTANTEVVKLRARIAELETELKIAKAVNEALKGVKQKDPFEGLQ